MQRPKCERVTREVCSMTVKEPPSNPALEGRYLEPVRGRIVDIWNGSRRRRPKERCGRGDNDCDGKSRDVRDTRAGGCALAAAILVASFGSLVAAR